MRPSANEFGSSAVSSDTPHLPLSCTSISQDTNRYGCANNEFNSPSGSFAPSLFNNIVVRAWWCSNAVALCSRSGRSTSRRLYRLSCMWGFSWFLSFPPGKCRDGPRSVPYNLFSFYDCYPTPLQAVGFTDNVVIQLQRMFQKRLTWWCNSLHFEGRRFLCGPRNTLSWLRFIAIFFAFLEKRSSNTII